MLCRRRLASRVAPRPSLSWRSADNSNANGSSPGLRSVRASIASWALRRHTSVSALISAFSPSSSACRFQVTPSSLLPFSAARNATDASSVGNTAPHPDAVRRILGHRAGLAGLTVEGFGRLSAHALRVGFITEAYDRGVRDEDIMRHTRHRDLRTLRGYVRRAGLVDESPAGKIDL